MVPLRVFLDTNALILFFEHDQFSRYTCFPRPLTFVTFEKCLYEVKNGLKRHFLDKEFLVRCIKERGAGGSGAGGDGGAWSGGEEATRRAARRVVARILDALNLPPRKEAKLREALKKYDLRFEFGIAEEYRLESPANMETFLRRFVREQDRDETGVLRMKQFYRLVKPFLLELYDDLERRLEAVGLEVVRYEAIFGDLVKMLEFRYLLDSSYLPTEDLEIVFSALATLCDVFVSCEKKLRGLSLTLGLNHVTRFVALKELDTALRELVC